MSDSDIEKKAWKTALDLLSRREHSEKELKAKLIQRSFAPSIAQNVFDKCRQLELQSDDRFCEMYVRSRVGRGYGPRKIQQELQERGLSEELIHRYLYDSHWDWLAHLSYVREKKFGKKQVIDQKDRASQIRFLIYRGFLMEQIHKMFRF